MTKARELSELAHIVSVSGTTATVAGTLVATTFTGDGSSLTGVGTFKPTSVTGNTPSLNVGTYNFFDQGTLTDNTTVSFTSVPTNANWRYSFAPSTINSNDISTLSYTRAFDISAQETFPTDVVFKPDGTKMFVLGDNADDLTAYNLSTVWDISTATVAEILPAAILDDYTPEGLFMRADGLKLYIAQQSAGNIDEFTMSTAWDISTATKTSSLYVYLEDSLPTAVFFKEDGLKMYMLGRSNDNVNEYTLSTAWDVTTATAMYTYSVVSEEDRAMGLFFTDSGSKMYIVSQFTPTIYEYGLSTAWDVTSASLTRSANISAENSDVGGIFFSPNGTNLYTVGRESFKKEVYQYSMGSTTTLTLPSSVVGTAATVDLGKRVTYEFLTLDGGTTVNLISEEII